MTTVDHNHPDDTFTDENAAIRAQLAALRAVVEEARDEIESWKINANLEVVANEAAVLAILDRVKGE